MYVRGAHGIALWAMIHTCPGDKGACDDAALNEILCLIGGRRTDWIKAQASNNWCCCGYVSPTGSRCVSLLDLKLTAARFCSCSVLAGRLCYCHVKMLRPDLEPVVNTATNLLQCSLALHLAVPQLEASRTPALIQPVQVRGIMHLKKCAKRCFIRHAMRTVLPS
jgi:hypothetical protein